MFKQIIKTCISDSSIRNLKKLYYDYFSGNSFVGIRHNLLENGNSILKHCKIEVYGTGNVIRLGGGNLLDNSKIVIFGSNNKIIIGSDNLLKDATFWIEDNDGFIEVGDNNKFCGQIQIASVEGQFIKIGNDNLFSSDIYITTTDSHSIIDISSKLRINPSLPVIIGTHNWIGTKTTILKGVELTHDIIIGANTLVVKSPNTSNCIIAGNPGRIIKNNISWDIKRL